MKQEYKIEEFVNFLLSKEVTNNYFSQKISLDRDGTFFSFNYFYNSNYVRTDFTCMTIINYSFPSGANVDNISIFENYKGKEVKVASGRTECKDYLLKRFEEDVPRKISVIEGWVTDNFESIFEKI